MSEGSTAPELASELILEEIPSGKPDDASKKWQKKVALSTLVLAMMAAVAGLLSGLTAHEALLERTEEIIATSMLEGDQVKVEVLKAKHQILLKLGDELDEAEVEEILTYEEEIKEMRREARIDERMAISSMQAHIIFALTVMLLAVGVSLSGMAVVVEQRWLWITGLVAGGGGAISLIVGILSVVL